MTAHLTRTYFWGMSNDERQKGRFGLNLVNVKLRQPQTDARRGRPWVGDTDGYVVTFAVTDDMFQGQPWQVTVPVQFKEANERPSTEEAVHLAASRLHADLNALLNQACKLRESSLQARKRDKASTKR